MNKIKVFLAGTDDVKFILENLEEKLGLIDYEPIWFHKKFDVLNENAMEECLKNVKNCDRLILILKERYGLPYKNKEKYTDGSYKSSITEEEFMTAFKASKPILVFLYRDTNVQSGIYHKNKKGEAALTYEQFERLKLKGQIGLYEFIERMQHLEKDGKKDIRWIETFVYTGDIIEQIEFKWGKQKVTIRSAPYTVPDKINPNDKRIEALKDLIKNLIIEHYTVLKKIHNESQDIMQIVEIMCRNYGEFYRNEYLGQSRPDYRKLIRKFFKCSLEELKKKITSKEIETSKIIRELNMYIGDTALIFTDHYENLNIEENLVENIRKDYEHNLHKYRFFQEDYTYNPFKKALDALKEYGFIKTIGEEYVGDSSKTKWEILYYPELKRFTEYYSINFFLRQLDDY